MRPSTEANYRSKLDNLLTWCRERCLSHHTLAQLEHALLRWMHELFYDGDYSHEGSTLLAALVYLRDDLSKGAPELPRARAALKGWQKVAPARSRLPPPWCVACLMINDMARRGHHACASATALTFLAYLRPSELLRIRVGHVTRPPRHGSSNLQHWSLLLHPYELDTPSKTAEFDESIIFDNQEFSWVAQLLARLIKGRGAHEPLFGLTYQEWSSTFSLVGAELGLGMLGPPTLYQLRHGGASHELLTGARDLISVKKRGRWASDQSLRRDEKGGRVNHQLTLLPKRTLRHAFACASKIGAILCKTLPPLLPP